MRETLLCGRPGGNSLKFLLVGANQKSETEDNITLL